MVRLWLARWLTKGTEYGVTRTADLEKLETRLVKLHRLSFISGHLSQAFHAGRKVRLGAQAALDSLFAARGKDGLQSHDTYANPQLREAFGEPEHGESRAA